MCNSYYHPPGCRCGFGGEGHLGKSLVNYGFGKASSTDFTLRDIDSYEFNHSKKKSYCVKNSTCPVCGDEVYFYKSENGGRVFFDELGPPWPKHPCTSDPSTFILGTKIPLKNDERSELEFQRRFETFNQSQKSNIEPVIIKRISRFKSYSLFYATEIMGFGRNFKFLLENEYSILEKSIVFIEELNPIDFVLQYFTVSKRGGEVKDSVKIYSLHNRIRNDSNLDDTVRFSKVMLNLNQSDDHKIRAFLRKNVGVDFYYTNPNRFRLPKIVYNLLIDEL